MEGDDAEAEDVPLFYDQTGKFQLSPKQKEIFNRIVKTIGTSPNNWKYCCQIVFTKFNKFIPTGKKTFEKVVLEVYLKIQYFVYTRHFGRSNESIFKELDRIKKFLEASNKYNSFVFSLRIVPMDLRKENVK